MKLQGSQVELDWSEYRSDRKRLFWAGIFTFPALILCKYILQFVMPSAAGMLTTGAFFLLAVGIDLSLLNNYIFSRCPNCRQPVHRRGNSGDPLSLQCINCGISIGAPYSQEFAPEKIEGASKHHAGTLPADPDLEKTDPEMRKP